VIEPPSQQLIKMLSEFGLCKPGDLRRCRPLVRRLAHDLPAFDSVWIDALVHTRKLTHFQARELESGRRNRLRVGPCVLLQRLGHSDQAETFLARRGSNREKCILKLIDVPIEERLSKLAALKELTADLRDVSHPSFVAPQSCLEHDGRLVAISRYVPGLHLGELLVRRGRFAASNVTAIARQLIDVLATLESQGRVHGDINLRNVRLTSAGTAVLIDTGVMTAVRPELTIHAHRPPERYEGIAPELIGTGNHPTPQSDLYALGCMLWQLLSGRPPFPTGDPLAKLASHQTKTICDVREWAPDTPAELAEFIVSITARNPLDRPASIGEVRQRFGPPNRAGRRRLSRFRAAFETAAPRNPVAETSGRARRWPAVLAVLIIVGVSLSLLDRGVRSDPLSIPGRITGFVQKTAANWFDANKQTDGSSAEQIADGDDRPSAFQQLPQPDANGLVLLDSNKSYTWRAIKSDGAIVIRGKAGLKPSIAVSQKSCRIEAGELTFENVHFVWKPTKNDGDATPSALLLVRSRQLTISGCSFETHDLKPQTDGDEPAKAGPVAIAWKQLESQQGEEDQIVVRDSVFLGRTAALFLSDVPTGVECVNSVKIGGGAMFMLSDNVPSGTLLSLRLKQLTLRQAGCLLKWRSPADDGARGFIAMQADDCVFDLAEGSTALLQFVGDAPIDSATTRIEVTGAESLARPGLAIAGQTTLAGMNVPLRDRGIVELEGITTGPFTFVGPVSMAPGDAVIDSFDMPRRSPEPPGIDASRLSTSSARVAKRLAN
jgi:eukaryotic-like serine/threonine-protein kinase